MREIRSDENIFGMPKENSKDACIVTTNGVVRKDGKAVMGAGIAKYCRDTFRGVDEVLGRFLENGRNHVYVLGWYPVAGESGHQFMLCSFPTKDDWRDDSKPELIRRSCKEITRIMDKFDIKNVYMPCPGCNNGRLDYWRDVRPILEEELDERFIVCVPTDIWNSRPDSEEEYEVTMKVTGYCTVRVKASNHEEAVKMVDAHVQSVNFGELESIDWEVADVS